MAHNHTSDHSGSKNIAIAFILNFSFTIIELIGGLLTNSVAILSDALHDFGDSISLALAWYFEKLSAHSPNARYSYGYKRFALLGALINSTVLLVGSSVVIYQSVLRILHPQPVVAVGMLWLAILGIIVNGIAVLRTHKKEAGVNERVVSLHLLEDVLGWLAVLVASVVMLFFDLPVLDPLLSVAISIFVLYNVFRNLATTFKIILQGVPSDVEYSVLRAKLCSVEGVVGIHDLHIWSLDSLYHVGSLHVIVPPETTTEEIVHLKQLIKEVMHVNGVKHVTVEFETTNESCDPCTSDV